jgi:hypothetical protein
MAGPKGCAVHLVKTAGTLDRPGMSPAKASLGSPGRLPREVVPWILPSTGLHCVRG